MHVVNGAAGGPIREHGSGHAVERIINVSRRVGVIVRLARESGIIIKTLTGNNGSHRCAAAQTIAGEVARYAGVTIQAVVIVARHIAATVRGRQTVVARIVSVNGGVADVVHRPHQPVNGVKRVGGLERLGRAAEVGQIHFGGLDDIVVDIVSVSDLVGLGVGDDTDAVGAVVERDGGIHVGVYVGGDLRVGAVGDAGDGVPGADVGLRRGIEERRIGHGSTVFQVVGVSRFR